MGPMHRALRQQLEKPRCAVAVISFKRHPSTSVITRTSKSLCVPILGLAQRSRGPFRRGWWEGRRPDPAIDPLVANEGLVASRVKADSRRRRGPKGRLYRACHEAILGHQVEGGAPVGGLPTSASRQFCSPRGKAEVGNASNSSARNCPSKACSCSPLQCEHSTA